MDLQVFKDEKDWIDAALKLFEDLQPKTVALSGGSTPKPIYEAMSKLDLKDVEFFQVDERYIPKDDENSNYRVIMETLKPENFQHFDTSLQIGQSLKQYAKKIPEQFDLIFLGIGPDGHTASLFPNSHALETAKTVAHTQTKEFAIRDRLTLSFQSILKAKELVVLLKGKEEVIKELQDGTKTTKEFPAKTLLQHPRLKILWLN